MLADISRLAEALLALVGVLSTATLAATWRIGTILGKMSSRSEDHAKRIDRIEAHEDAHDAWHLSRGDR